MDIIKKLKDCDIIKTGEFILKSGEKSNTYFDFRNLISHPNILKEITNLLVEKTTKINELVVGVPMGAIPLATCYSQVTELPMILVRNKKKDHGISKMIDGKFNIGQKVILIEDVITSGKSVRETIKKLELEGLIVNEIICILDRQGGGIDELSKKYKTTALFKLSDFKKRKQLCFALDLTNKKDFMNMIDKVGTYVDIVKTHIDIIEDVNDDFIKELKLKSKEYNFKIWEDRKFADIGSIVEKQLLSGYKIAEWADYISVHLISGESIINSIKEICIENDIKIFVIYEMSSKGNLIDESYKEKVKNIISNNKDLIVGAVTQSFISEEILHVTPGINLELKTDGKGQQYKNIKDLKFTDIYVIGRGIYNATDPKEALFKYKCCNC